MSRLVILVAMVAGTITTIFKSRTRTACMVESGDDDGGNYGNFDGYD